MSSTDDVNSLLSFMRLFIEENAGNLGVLRAPDEKKSIKDSISTWVREISTIEGTPTSTAMTLNEKPTKKPGGLRQQYPEYACPVPGCRAVTQSEEELLEHFQVHKTGRLCRVTAQGPPSSKPGAKPYSMVKAVVRKLRHTIC